MRDDCRWSRPLVVHAPLTRGQDTDLDIATVRNLLNSLLFIYRCASGPASLPHR